MTDADLEQLQLVIDDSHADGRDPVQVVIEGIELVASLDDLQDWVNTLNDEMWRRKVDSQ